MLSCLTSVAAFGLAITPLSGTSDSAARSEIIETQRDSSRRMTVPVTIGGEGPHRFVVDTGSQRTVVSARLAAQLGLEATSVEMLVSILDRRRVEVVDLPPLQLGGELTTRLRAPVLLARDIGADGILGLDSLRGRRVEIQDFGRCLRVFDDNDGDLSDEGQRVRISARERDGQLIVMGSEATGFPVSTVLDTGAEINVGNSRLLRLLQRRGGVEIVETREITAVTGAVRTARIGYIREITIGNAQLRNLAVAFLDSPALDRLGLANKPTLILGMNSLAAFERVLIDFPARRITFVTPSARVQSRSMSVTQRFGG